MLEKKPLKKRFFYVCINVKVYGQRATGNGQRATAKVARGGLRLIGVAADLFRVF
jgi:hypothetical protein